MHWRGDDCLGSVIFVHTERVLVRFLVFQREREETLRCSFGQGQAACVCLCLCVSVCVVFV